MLFLNQYQWSGRESLDRLETWSLPLLQLKGRGSSTRREVLNKGREIQ